MSGPQSILDHLRAHTAEAHREMESRIDIPRLCQSVESYKNLLADFLGYYEPLEARLAALPGWEEQGFDWSQRSKVSWLRADLKALGLSDAAVDSLPRAEDLPTPDNLPQAFGCAYVLEGATLGGRHIMGVLEHSQIPAETRTFYRSYGENVGSRWKEFCQMIDALDPSRADEMADQASQTFALLARWLSRNGK